MQNVVAPHDLICKYWANSLAYFAELINKCLIRLTPRLDRVTDRKKTLIYLYKPLPNFKLVLVNVMQLSN
jgi:hypothetical protein